MHPLFNCIFVYTEINRIFAKNYSSLEIVSTEDKKIVVSLQNELVDVLLKKAKIRKKTLYDSAIRNFVNNNVDLLSPAELKKYHSILLL